MASESTETTRGASSDAPSLGEKGRLSRMLARWGRSKAKRLVGSIWPTPFLTPSVGIVLYVFAVRGLPPLCVSIFTVVFGIACALLIRHVWKTYRAENGGCQACRDNARSLRSEAMTGPDNLSKACWDSEFEMQALVKQYEYWVDRQKALNTWRDAILLAFSGAYAALGATLVGKLDARWTLASSGTDGVATWGPFAGLMVLLVSVVGLLVLRRLAVDRAHNARAINAIEAVTGRMEALANCRLPPVLSNGRVFPLSGGGQVTSDTVVMVLNAISLGGGALLLRGEEFVPAAATLWVPLLAWIAAVLYQFLCYSIWASVGDWEYTLHPDANP